ncbi:hypothetical protein OS188_06875 [Xanthomarina sp. F1114]|uniref:hypothetical protein n=1 Tax=Xanthomarina sp. F1114 TaxID=2996019 RepID=UPI00225E5161|nr:hypothetical protein [Xanthomarina sp. F1114]MCX7547670.1 hypothetical protein [Xanthomarina sp. F1114]
MFRFIILLLLFTCSPTFAQNDNIIERKVVIEHKKALTQQEYLTMPKTKKRIINTVDSTIQREVSNRKTVVLESLALTSKENAMQSKSAKSIVKLGNLNSTETDREIINLEIQKAYALEEYLLQPKIEKKIVKH